MAPRKSAQESPSHPDLDFIEAIDQLSSPNQTGTRENTSGATEVQKRKIEYLESAWPDGIWVPIKYRPSGWPLPNINILFSMTFITKEWSKAGLDLPKLWTEGGPLYEACEASRNKVLSEPIVKKAKDSLRDGINHEIRQQVLSTQNGGNGNYDGHSSSRDAADDEVEEMDTFLPNRDEDALNGDVIDDNNPWATVTKTPSQSQMLKHNQSSVQRPFETWTPTNRNQRTAKTKSQSSQEANASTKGTPLSSYISNNRSQSAKKSATTFVTPANKDGHKRPIQTEPLPRRFSLRRTRSDAKRKSGLHHEYEMPVSEEEDLDMEPLFGELMDQNGASGSRIDDNINPLLTEQTKRETLEGLEGTEWLSSRAIDMCLSMHPICAGWYLFAAGYPIIDGINTVAFLSRAPEEQYKHFVFILHVSGNHWAVGHWDRSEHVFVLYDSMQSSDSLEEVEDFMSPWLRGSFLMEYDIDLKFVHGECPQQEDCHNCGTFSIVFASALLTGQLIPTSIDPDAVRKHYLEKGMGPANEKQPSPPAAVSDQSTITARLTRQGVKRLRQREISPDYHNVESEDLDGEPVQKKKKKVPSSLSIEASPNHASLPVELVECRELVDKAVSHVASLSVKRDSKNAELQTLDTEMVALKAKMEEMVKDMTAREADKVAMVAEIETMEKGLSFWKSIAESTGI